MEFSNYLNYNHIIELESKTFRDAVQELLFVNNFKGNTEEVIYDLCAKEEEISSCLGNKVAVLNLRTSIAVPYEIFVGKSKIDIKCGPGRSGEYADVFILVLASKHERGYLKIISELVAFFQSTALSNRLHSAESFDEFRRELTKEFKKIAKSSKFRKSEARNFFLHNCAEIARTSGCSSVMLFNNEVNSDLDIEDIFDGMRVISVIHDPSERTPVSSKFFVELRISSVPANWLHGFRGAILLGITRNIIANNERICCVCCNSGSEDFDTLFIVDVEREFKPIFTSHSKLLQSDVQPEVLERVLSVACEIALEGREGKAVGCLFVIGNIDRISLFMKPLVLNPFYGYPESDRNIMSQFMNETIKEFSLIDGAFVIRGDGIIESAGTLIYTPNHNIIMPSGFGTRHSAAASITWAAECVAIAVSESTRAVTLFQNGQMLQIMQK